MPEENTDYTFPLPLGNVLIYGSRENIKIIWDELAEITLQEVCSVVQKIIDNKRYLSDRECKVLQKYLDFTRMMLDQILRETCYDGFTQIHEIGLLQIYNAFEHKAQIAISSTEYVKKNNPTEYQKFMEKKQ